MGKATVIPFGPQHPVLPEPLHLDLVVEDVRARRHGEARAVADYLAPVSVQDAAARGLRVDRARAV